MIDWMTRKKVAPIHVMPGDTVHLTYHGADGRKEEVTSEITETQIIDTMAVGVFKDELGMESGVVAVMGKEKES